MKFYYFAILVVQCVDFGSGASLKLNSFRNAASNYTGSHLMRYRRDAMDTEPNICCGSEAKMPEPDKECQKLKEFNKELTGDERDWAELMAMGCTVECQEKATGSWDGKQFDTGKLVMEMKELYPMDWVDDMIKKNFDECFSDAAKIHAEFAKADDNLKCNLVPFFTAICVYRAVELGCPKDDMVASSSCDETRTSLKATDYKDMA